MCSNDDCAWTLIKQAVVQVYYGMWKDTEVAVKVLMADSADHNSQMAKEVRSCQPAAICECDSCLLA